ncbi:nuclear transport factor 2 family protein [Amycolatopsis pigmentata]|uniref:Nuclear transport factor 2 family protein n=1 Tax=Amycolatopsis pigmentata TaxID=450801 RepID=A0ABW5G9F4_9PSEU
MASENVSRVFGIVDSGDAAAFGRLFSEGGRMVFGNGDPIHGPDRIAESVGEFFATIKGLRHAVRNEWTVGPDTIIELAVTYDRLDGKTVTVPAVTMWRAADDGLIDDYRIYIDLAPVYA